jgi:hypothetical protein
MRSNSGENGEINRSRPAGVEEHRRRIVGGFVQQAEATANAWR